MEMRDRDIPVTRAWRGMLCALLLVPCVVPREALARQRHQNQALDHAFRSFWNASDPRDRQGAVSSILLTGADPDTIAARLREGRTYPSRVPKGRLLLTHQTSDGFAHQYVLVVPAGYDPGTPMPVRIYLHGGVNTEELDSGQHWDFDRFAPPDEISIFPSAWRGAMWWQANQLENITGILRTLRQTYNVDENRIYAFGVSDGGTGAFFLAFKVPMLFAGVLPLLGHPGPLANPALNADGPFYVVNLRNVPLFVVNGALDPLYPADEVAPYIALFRSAGVDVTFHPRPETGHDLRWWPAEEPAIDSFLAHHVRNPLPDRISWEADRTDRDNRAFWLVIDELGPSASDTILPTFDSIMPLPPAPTLGVRTDPSSTRGVRLQVVELGSIAARSGLRAGDLILEANGAPTPTVRALVNATRGLDWGDSIAVLVERQGRKGRTVILLGPRPDPSRIRPVQAFPHPGPSGRVVLERHGNTVEVHSSYVRRFTLLLSPDLFDFSQPIRVITNGQVSWDGLVRRNPAVLLRWAAADMDRTMLFAAELPIQVP